LRIYPAATTILSSSKLTAAPLNRRDQEGEQLRYVMSQKGFSSGTSLGVSGYFSINRPYVAEIESAHSLVQIQTGYTLSSSPTTLAGTVEMGWIVTNDPIGNTDAVSSTDLVTDFQPHLFVFWSANNYVNGSYNVQCGAIGIYACASFVPKSGAIFWPGIALTPGDFHTFSTIHLTTAPTAGWHLYVDNNDIGYYPDYIWSGQFTSATIGTWQGEVASSSSSPTTAMGSGRFGDDPSESAASVGLARYYDQNLVAQSFTPDFVGVSPATATSGYHIGPTAFGSFTYGGPGAAAAAAFVPGFTRTYVAPCGCWIGGNSVVTAIDVFDSNATSYPVAFGSYGWSANGRAVSPDGSTLFLNAGTYAAPGQSQQAILALDAGTMAIKQTVTWPTDDYLTTILAGPSGSTLYLGSDYPPNYPSGAIFSLTSTGGLSPAITSGNHPNPFAVTSDGRTLFAIQADSSLAVIDLASGSVSAPIMTGWGIGTALRPDQSAIWTLNNGITATSFGLDLTTGKPKAPYTVSTLPVAGFPGMETSIAFSPDSTRAYVASVSADYTQTFISTIDTATGNLATGIPNPITIAVTQSNGTSDISLSADGSILFVDVPCTLFNASQGGCISDTVSRVDTATGAVLSAVTVTSGGGNTYSTIFGGGRTAVRPITAGTPVAPQKLFLATSR
jgi:hypothetical protein